jgi:hypothetical protein
MTRRNRSRQHQSTLGRHPAPPWAKLSAALAIAAEIIESVLHPALAEVLGIADLIIPVIVMLVVFTVVVRGSPQTVDKVFRLLRWITNRPEPVGPPEST